jgi:hypothetical protein
VVVGCGDDGGGGDGMYVSIGRRRCCEVWPNAIACTKKAVEEDLSIHLHHKLVVCSRLAGVLGLAWPGLACLLACFPASVLGGRRLNSK